MQRIKALELKPGPKKCIVIVHILHTCTIHHPRTTEEVDGTLPQTHFLKLQLRGDLGWSFMDHALF